MCTGSEMHIGTANADQLGCSQARLGSETEQRVITSPGPGRLIGSGKQRADFGLGQEGHEPSVEALGRDGENALDDGGMIGMAKCGVSEQRADRGKPSVAGARAIFSLVLEVVEEGADQRGIEIVDIQLGWFLTFFGRREDQQQPESVPVRSERMRTDLALSDQAIREECLQGRGQCGHARPPR